MVNYDNRELTSDLESEFIRSSAMSCEPLTGALARSGRYRSSKVVLSEKRPELRIIETESTPNLNNMNATFTVEFEDYRAIFC